MSIKILLVDDNAVFLTAMRHLLARVPGVEVIAQAMDGLEALVNKADVVRDLLPVLQSLVANSQHHQ